MVPGGNFNRADGNYSFAAGLRARANNDGAFVWADSQGGPVSAVDFVSNPGGAVSGTNTFHVRAQNGVRFVTDAGTTHLSSSSTGWNPSSSRAAKTNVESVDPEQVLAGVGSLEVSTWEYRDGSGTGLGTRHMGPMAEEFHAAFDDLGDDDTSINSINADGVAFAAIQGLSMKLEDKAERIDELEREVDQKDDRIETVEEETAALREENERLREQYTDLEARVDALEA